MGFKKGENPHHPRKGASIKADPIRDLNAIARIKEQLTAGQQERNLCLFTVGINTAWRANELLSMRIWQVQEAGGHSIINLKQSKTSEYRMTPINDTARKALRRWLAYYQKHYPHKYKPNALLFPSQRGDMLLVSSYSKMVKHWCLEAGLMGKFSSHTIRKTWGYHQRASFHEPVSLISQALGHSSEEETLAYIGILPAEVDNLYRHEL